MPARRGPLILSVVGAPYGEDIVPLKKHRFVK